MRSVLYLLISLAALPAFAVKVGYNINIPQMYRTPEGAPTGFVVEVVDAAAKRAGISVEWVFLDRGATFDSFDKGEIDLWPAGVATPARRQRLHITRPWWKTDVMILARQPIAGVGDLRGRRTGHTTSAEAELQQALPDTVLVPAPGAADLARGLCRGEMDAIVLDRLLADRFLLNRSGPCATIPLRMFGLPNLFFDLSIVSSKQTAALADRLERAISSLSADGSMTNIALRYSAMSGASAGFLAFVSETNHRYQQLRVMLAFVCVLLLASASMVYILARNIARRRRVEAALRRTNADLEQFNWAVHHDLSEPTRNIAVLSELLERERGPALDAEAQQSLRWIREGAQRMTRLLDSLRKYTDIWYDTGKSVRVSAEEALNEAIANLDPQVQSSNAAITHDRLPSVPYGHAHLVQLFQNLIANAMKYRGPDPPHIHISAAKKGSSWTFCVTDNGIGIPEEHRDRIFRVFKRLHGSDIPGTGIGLAICRNIVERNGGRIWVESHPGSGSRFCFTIPVRAPKPEPVRPASQQS